MKKRAPILLIVVMLVASLLFAAGCSGAKKTNEKTGEQSVNTRQVKVAYYGGTCEAPIYIAYEKGIFKQKGLDVELIKVDSNTLNEGVATGKIDAVQLSPGVFKPIEQGLDIKITDGVHTGCIQAVVPINSPIQSINDFKGKTIGVDAIGGVPMTLLSIELGKKGVNPKTDVTWKAFPGPQLTQAMEKGEIDAFATWDPFGQLAINDKKARLIFSSTHDEQYKDIYCCFIGINGKLVKDQPELARTITAALNEASLWVEQNPKEAAKISIEQKYTSGDIETTGQLLEDYKFVPDKAKSKESLKFFLNGLKDQQILEQSTDPNKLFENIFLDL